MCEKCKTCKYRSYLRDGELFCQYILIEHHSRICPADENCDKYEEGDIILGELY